MYICTYITATRCISSLSSQVNFKCYAKLKCRYPFKEFKVVIQFTKVRQLQNKRIVSFV